MCILWRMNKLAQHLSASGVTQADFASRVGVDQSTISRLTRGGSPSWALAARIEKATGGVVLVSDWAELATMRGGNNGCDSAAQPAEKGGVA